VATEQAVASNRREETRYAEIASDLRRLDLAFGELLAAVQILHGQVSALGFMVALMGESPRHDRAVH
jgi:hypothetical protein